jgi:micrococcal nuclease
MIFATILTCLVIGITDGDTINVLCDADKAPYTVKVRLAEIDAPEKKQAFGQKSKDALSDLCFNQMATIKTQGQDKYNRTLARVSCKGQDAASHMVQAGMAWAYTKYLTDTAIEQLQTSAQKSKRGLWADENPTSPWEWRHTKHEKLAN